MASGVPDKLKAADIARFAQRATQVEPYKPPIAYWAYYYIVKQILDKNLHSADDACKEYTTQIMDKLERMKTLYSLDEAITDDLAGQAYVEQFGMEIFQRADNAVIANKATRTTGDNFWTAATFLDLLHIWGEPSPDIARKIKYAKVEAARIFKAIKAGEDPNLSNPAPAQPASDAPAVALDPNDPDVQRLNSAAAALSEAPGSDAASESSQPAQASTPSEHSFLQSAKKRTHEPLWPPRPPPRPSVVEVPDEHDNLQKDLARQSSLDESLHPSRAPSIPPPANNAPLAQPPASSQPFVDEADSNPRKDSSGGGYFPETEASTKAASSAEHVAAPQPMSPAQGLADPPQGLPQPSYQDNVQSYYASSAGQPSSMPLTPASMPQQPPGASPGWSATPPPQAQSHPPPTAPPTGWAATPPPQAQSPPPPTAPTAGWNATPPPQLPSPPPPSQNAYQQYPQHQQYQQTPPSIPQQPQQPVPAAAPPAPAPVQAVPQSYLTDDTAMTEAQKHAKWAISALNFEDVPTAVKELREALRSLGAS